MLIPERIKTGFIFAAKDLLYELENNCLKVALIPAPEERHSGHMIRAAVSQNALWFQEFTKNRGKNTDRKRVIKALNKIIDDEKLTGVYDFELFEVVKNTLIHEWEDPETVNYFVHGVPF